MARRYDLPTLRAALWAGRALIQVRRGLRSRGVEGVTMSSPPSLPASAERGVLGLLRRVPGTCLEQALVLQRWRAAQGDEREVVIGVRVPPGTFQAHAWLDGEPDGRAAAFQELMRLSP